MTKINAASYEMLKFSFFPLFFFFWFSLPDTLNRNDNDTDFS